MLRTRRTVAGVMAVALTAALAACGAAPEPVTTSPRPAQSATPGPTFEPGDGVLTIGTLFPTTGAQAFISPAQRAGVDLAIGEINKAGGVLGQPVVAVHADSGEAKTKKAESSYASLVKKGADVIIGPSSSVLAERILPLAIRDRVPLISPAATAPRLSGLADAGMLFRTVPSAALQGSVLARLASGDEQIRLAVVYFDDDTGRATLATATATVAELGGRLVSSQKVTSATKKVDGLVAAVKASKPDAVILATPFSAMAQNKAIIAGLTKAGLGHERLWFISANLADYSQALPAGMLLGARGVIPGAEPSKAFRDRVKAAGKNVKDYRYSAEAYDATMLAALAAIVAGNDNSEAVAASLVDVSAGGIKCVGLAECLDVLHTQSDIDYDGVSGPVNLSQEGDPSPAHYGLYKYDKANKFARVDRVVGN